MNFDRSLGKWSLKIAAKSDLQNLCLGDKRFLFLGFTEDLDLDLLEAARRIIQIPKISSFYS